IPWDQNPEALAKWAEGRTGFPWIDAIMTQLRQEGWIHHRARHAVACFLTRGDLWISWESGMKVGPSALPAASQVEGKPTDGVWSYRCITRNGFISAYHQLVVCCVMSGFSLAVRLGGYNLRSFLLDVQPQFPWSSSDSSYRRYIPILKDYPNRYIYEPWNAPESLQKAVKCVVGVDYPKPMINHAEGSRLNIERMKQ
ncbi:hypothetical protein GOODEAATRI_029383, partial [Goodea atripinnis]